jgi:hypothetical protein
MFFVLCRIFYGDVSTATFVVRNKKRSLGIISANSLRREFMVCLKILKGYSFGQDSEMIIQINHQPDATVFQFIILTFI